jgi:hypothetical protein
VQLVGDRTGSVTALAKGVDRLWTGLSWNLWCPFIHFSIVERSEMIAQESVKILSGLNLNAPEILK